MSEALTFDEATLAQIGAADPNGSVWLAANAGSGKTRVLTNRVAWLLLEGTRPENILCLTYTKAAAGEMQNRLFEQLGKWTMMSDPDLRADLRKLGVKPGRITPEQLSRARTLFASAIETPGGLKIQTIHAFCASLLRRFPLEAGVSPAFQEMDDIAKARLHLEVLDEMSEGADRALVDGVAQYLTDPDPSGFLASIASQWPAGQPGLEDAALRAALGIGPETAQDLREGAVDGDALSLLSAVKDAAASETAVTMFNLSESLAEALLADTERRFDLLCGAFLTQKGEPRKSLVTKPVSTKLGDGSVEALTDFAFGLAEAQRAIAALGALDRARALHAFAPAFTAAVEARKAARALLDFDDQIDRARRLLTRADMAQWVLFKLDGGVDHILVDEAQDTSPQQWEVIETLVAEFAAGEGARPDLHRTLFVVGDLKQSIYSFQGADPRAFSRMRDRFRALLAPDGLPDLRDHQMRHSFRSSPVILELVDRVFSAGGGVGDAPSHVAFNADLPGRVDIWDPVETETPDLSDRKWFDPVDRPAANDAKVVLAEQIADAIHGMLRDGTPIVHKGERRAARAEDVLILFQSRSDLFHHTIRACKARGLDLAGADRLKLMDDLAVKDLLATLAFVAVPQDDLSLATVLRSPLGALDEDGLFRLAHGREGRPLWDVLRDAGTDPGAISMLTDLLKVADILRPYELLQRILITHDGRRRLLGRLGTESVEAMDALLDQALLYEQLETPSLQGFLGWLASAEVEVKREVGRGSIRVMTVHGSKGLEAPVVILPDTAMRRPRGLTGVQTLNDGTVIWLPTRAEYAPALHSFAEEAAAADKAERDRLLYVAMTRAESWLIVCAAGKVGDASEDSWYSQIRAGLESGPHHAAKGILRLEAGDWTPIAPERTPDPDPRPILPVWGETLVAPPPQSIKPISPSALPGAKTLPGAAQDGSDDAMARGTALHLLLEHLANAPTDRRESLAAALLAPTGLALSEVLPDAKRILEAPDLAHLFTPGTLSEVDFALPAEGGLPPIVGTMDRVLVTDGTVLVVDYKSNQIIPDHAQDTPVGLLRQMAAYGRAARAIWPEHEITLAILWTRTGQLMPLAHDLVTAAWASMPIDPAPADA